MSSDASAAKTTAFLRRVYSFHERGYVFLAARAPNSVWHERAFRIPVSRPDLASFFRRFPASHFDIYFCPNAFLHSKRAATYALPTSFSWCDIDDGNPKDFEPQPNITWRTSPARFQGLWIWNRRESASRAEAFSRALAYDFGGDRNGWSCTKMLRIPGSINHKPQYRNPRVQLIDPISWRPRRGRPLLSGKLASHSAQRVPMQVDPYVHELAAVFSRFRMKIHLRPRILLRHTAVREPDRSKCIFEIIAALQGAGASTDEIASLLWRSPYFIEKHGRSLRHLNAEISRVLAKLEQK